MISDSGKKILKRHIDILKVIEKEGPIGRNRLAKILGISNPSKIRNSLVILQENNLIVWGIQGANVEKNWKELFISKLEEFHQEILENLEPVLK